MSSKSGINIDIKAMYFLPILSASNLWKLRHTLFEIIPSPIASGN